MRFPELVSQTRTVELVQPARGGRIHRVVARLDNGHAVQWWELTRPDGLVVPAETYHDARDAALAERG